MASKSVCMRPIDFSRVQLAPAKPPEEDENGDCQSLPLNRFANVALATRLDAISTLREEQKGLKNSSKGFSLRGKHCYLHLLLSDAGNSLVKGCSA